jgi:hypothetical protein
VHFSRPIWTPNWKENHRSIDIYQHRTVTVVSWVSRPESVRLLAVWHLKGGEGDGVILLLRKWWPFLEMSL